MSDSNNQNNPSIIKDTLINCSYNKDKIDNLVIEILKIINYPKKKDPVKYFIKNVNQDKIIIIRYPICITLIKKEFNIPIQIEILKNYPNEAPKIFLELDHSVSVNKLNKDIDSNTGQIMTNTLRDWNQNSKIENVLNEIVLSFSNNYPINKNRDFDSKSVLYHSNTYYPQTNMISQILEGNLKHNEYHSNILYNNNYENEREKDSYSFIKNSLCVCPECGYFVEIINEDKKNIEIKCFNCIEKNGQGTKMICIKDYLQFLSSLNICCSCKNEQNNQNLNYCSKCKQAFCFYCLEKHMKEDNECKIMNYNDRGIRCFYHPQSYNIYYCEQCKKHLCTECLKTREHKGHKKIDFLEIELTKEEKDKFEEIIQLFINTKNTLEKEKKDKTQKKYNTFIKKKGEEDLKYKTLLEKIEEDLKAEIEKEKKKNDEECNALYLEYVKQTKLKKDELTKKIEEITKTFETIKDIKKTSYEKTIKKLEESNNEIKKIENSYNQKIDNIDDIIKINEIINNSIIANEKNYFAYINFSKVLSILDKNSNDIINELINDNNCELNNDEKNISQSVNSIDNK